MSRFEASTQDLPRRRVGLFLPGAEWLRGGGGAERFCADLFAAYRRWPARRFDVRLLTDVRTAAELQAAGRLVGTEDVVTLAESRADARRPVGMLLLALRLRRARVCLIHAPHVDKLYAPALRCARGLAGPRLSAQVVDVAAGRALNQCLGSLESDLAARVAWHRGFLRWARPDGIHTWYPEVRDELGAWPVSSRAHLHCGEHYFVDLDKFRPAACKRLRITFATRLVPDKRPLWLLQAVEEIAARVPGLLRGWEVVISGDGPLRAEVEQAASAPVLRGLVVLRKESDLAETFASSRLFVSAQRLENFSSMGLLEAMAAGNGVLAFDVGQTRRLVHPGVNGLLAPEESAAGLAEALETYLSSSVLQDRFCEAGRRIATSDFAEEPGLREMESFWESVLTRGMRGTSRSSGPAPRRARRWAPSRAPLALS